MNPFGTPAKFLMAAGALVFFAGLVLALAGKIPWLGHLPGDILLRRKNLVVYIPLSTALLLSLVISFVAWLIQRR